LPKNTGLSVRLYRKYNDRTLIDISLDAWTSLTYSTAYHGGFKECNLTIPMNQGNAWLYMQREAQPGRHMYHLEIMEGHELRWEGRIMSVGLEWGTAIPHSLALTALGYWNSCYDEIVTMVDYSAGVQTPDGIIKAMLTAYCPAINADQSNIETAIGNVQTVLPVDNYTLDHIVDSLAPMGDTSLNTYYFAIWDDRIPYYAARSVDAIDWEVLMGDIGRGRIVQAAQWLRNGATAFDGTNRTASASDSESESLYTGRNKTVLVPAGTTTAIAENARDRYIEEHKIPQQESSFLVTGDPIQPYRFGPTTGKRSAIRAGQVIKIIDLIPAATASPELDNLRTFFIVETVYDASRDSTTVIPDRPPAQLRVILSRLGIEVGR